MPDNGNYQLQTLEGVRLCEIVSQSTSLDRAKVATRLVGGGWLYQTIGTPSAVHTLNLRAWTRAEQQAVNEAEAACSVIAAKLGSTTVTGVILDAPGWSVISDAGIFETTVQFAEASP